MSRTWRAERSTSKKDRQKVPQKPCVTDFAREYYQGQGYQVEATMTPPVDAEEGYLLDSRGMHP